MQNQILGFFIVTSIALGALCGVQWHQARQQRHQAVMLRAKLENNAIEMDGLQSNLQTLRSDQVQIQREQSTLNGLVSKLMQTTNVLAQEVQSAKAEVAASWPRWNDPSCRAWASAIGTNLYADPRALEWFRSQQSWTWRALCGVFAEDTALAPEERARLSQRLAEDRLERIQARLEAVQHPLQAAQLQPLRQALNQAQTKKSSAEGAPTPTLPGDTRTLEAKLQSHWQRQEMEERLFLDQARTFLAAEQFETLTAWHTNSVRTQQLGLEWVREMIRQTGGPK